MAASNSQSSHISALVSERHIAVKQDVESILDALASNERSAVQAANEKLIESLQRLGDVIAKEHWPNWLKALLSQGLSYRNNHANGTSVWRNHLNTLITFRGELESQTWFFDQEIEAPFDVDKIIDDARQAFLITELFDKIIATLNKMIECGELDSVKAYEDLNRVILLLIKSKKGSLSSQIISWNFARRFIPNLIGTYLKKNSVTGTFIEAFEETAKDLDVSLNSMKDKVGNEILNAASLTFRSQALPDLSAVELKQLPDFNE